MSLHLAAICGSALVGACAGDGPTGPRVSVVAAPLNYPAVSNVCYGLTVYNGVPGAIDTATVWSKDGVCSATYGNLGGGDISYVGPCDADVDGDNYIALTLETIAVGNGRILLDQVSAASIAGADAEFENPCTAEDRCVLHFECKENADVAVEFNLTVMRDAEQGFFDIAVNFDDVFCSAKVDSCYALGQPIEQLFGDDIYDGPGRDLTTIAAVACTAGVDVPGHGFDTSLLFTSKTVSCDGGVVFTLDPVGDQGGNRTAQSGDYTLHYAHYFDAEDLACGQMQRTDANGDLYFQCGDETCRIAGFAPPNGLGYGGSAAASAAAAAAAGGYGGYGAQGSQGSGHGGYGAGAGAAAAGLGYGGYAAAAGVTLRYYQGDTEIFPELDGEGEPILPGWIAIFDPLSCNKTFYNTAIDVENLIGQGLSGCTLSFYATALASDDTTSGFDASSGMFQKQGGLYGAIAVADVPLMEADGPGVRATCNAHPLDGLDLYGNPSKVKTQYIGTLADTNPAFCFHSDNGDPLDQFFGCGSNPPIECLDPHCIACTNSAVCDQCAPGYVVNEDGMCIPIPLCDAAAHCQVCGTWGDPSLDCTIDIEGTVTCELKDGPANTAVILLSPNGYTSVYLTTDGAGSATFVVGANSEADGTFFYLQDAGTDEVYVTNGMNCEICAGGYLRNIVGLCVPRGGGAGY